MCYLLAFIDDYHAAVTAGATLILAILTFVLCLENRALRKAGSSPYISAFLRPHSDGTGGVDMVIANVGKGPAFDVNFTLEHDLEDFLAHNVLFSDEADRSPINAIPQEETMKFLFGIGYQLYGEINEQKIGPMKPFSIVFTYKDIFGKSHSSLSVVDIRQFSGMGGIFSKAHSKIMADSLVNIDRSLQAISSKASVIAPLIEATTVRDSFVKRVKGDNKS